MHTLDIYKLQYSNMHYLPVYTTIALLVGSMPTNVLATSESDEVVPSSTSFRWVWASTLTESSHRTQTPDSSTRSAATHTQLTTTIRTDSRIRASPSTSVQLTTQRSSSITRADICTYTRAAHDNCFADPSRAVRSANARAAIVGAVLGTILAIVLSAALLAIFHQQRKLRKARTIVKEQSRVLWKIKDRDATPMWHGR